MICKACGADVPSEALFCPKCGERLGPAVAASPEAQTPRPTTQPQTAAERLRGAVQPGEATDSDDYDPEDMLWQGGYSGKAMIGSWALAFLVSIALAVGCFLALDFGQAFLWFLGLTIMIWAAVGLVLAYRKLSVHYELTSQRFVHKAGILRRTTDRIEVIDMDDVTYDQGLVQRMLGVGRIKITSSDRSHPELWLLGIDEVQRVAGLIDDTRRKERRRRGLHIEAI